MMNTAKQQGFVSIIVASILMVLLSLVTVGFSQFMQREQRQALDRQLSAQAFYAAETAVNDVYREIRAGNIVAEKADCDTSSQPFGGVLGSDISDDTVAYSCLTIDPTPARLVYDNGAIDINSATVVPLNSESGNFSSVDFSWSGRASRSDLRTMSCAAGDVNRPENFNADEVPMLRVDLIDLSTGVTRDNLFNNARTFFLMPAANCGDTTINYATSNANNGNFTYIRCSGTGSYPCSVEFTGLTSPNYVARVRSVYQSADLEITGSTPAGTASFVDAQIEVDATGKANDVLRRIKVNFSTTGSTDFVPAGAAHGYQGFCKQLEIYETSPADVRYNCY